MGIYGSSVHGDDAIRSGDWKKVVARMRYKTFGSFPPVSGPGFIVKQP